MLFNTCRIRLFFPIVALCLVLFTEAKAQCTFTVSTSASTICAGNSVTLSASGTTNYTWSPGGNGATIVHSPPSTQQYTVNGSDGVCTTTQTITIVVVPVPTVAASSSTPAICAGKSAVLSATTNISGPDAGLYWMPGMSTAATITVTPMVGTVYTVVVYNGGGACTASTTVQLPVYANPSLYFTVSEPTLCSGNQLTVTPGGAVSYTIIPGNYTTTSEFYLTAVAAEYTVTGENANYCVASAVVPVTVEPTPNLVISHTPTFICAGQSTTLFTSGADFYNWQPGNYANGTVVISPTVSGNYTVLGYNVTGCSASATTALAVNGTPTLTFLNSSFATCSGAPISLSVTGANNYTWLPANSIGSVLTVSITANTIYTVTGTGSNGCTQNNYAQVFVSSNPVLNIAGPSTLCAGSTVTLTASGAATYTWAPGNITTNSIALSPSSSQVYTAFGQSSAGCNGSATATLSVIPLPSLLISTSSASICSGQSVSVFASGAQNYTWMPGNISSASFTISPGSSVSYTVTGASAGCIKQDSLQIVVWPVPVVTITGDTTVCEGTMLSLLASGANAYTWTPYFNTGAQLTLTPASDTQFTVTGMNNYGCWSEATVNTIVSPTPSLLSSVSPSSSCGIQTHTLTATGANSYTWQPGNIQAATFTLSSATSQDFTVTGTLGDCASSDIVSINVFPLPNISVVSSHSMICSGESATLAVSGAMTYMWEGGSQDDTLIVFPIANTSYTVIGTNAQGCSSTFTFVQEVSDCVGLTSGPAIIEANIYPNPNNGTFYVNITDQGDQSYAVKLYNVHGQLVYSKNTREIPVKVNAADLPSGVYTITIVGTETASKFISKLVVSSR